jgi:hypothetical protein
MIFEIIKKILFVFSRRSKSIGQGIFTFYSAAAKDIHTDIQTSVKWWEDHQGRSGGTTTRTTPAADATTVLPRSGRLTNPLAFLFHRSQQGDVDVAASPTAKIGTAVADTVLIPGSCRSTKQEKGKGAHLEPLFFINVFYNAS